MPHTPPIKIQELRKRGILDEKNFFASLSEQNNYVDERTVRNFYMGLVRVLSKELRKYGVVRLPHLGDLVLLRQKPALKWAGPIQKIIGGTYAIKFYANNNFRAYFNTIAKRSGAEGNLDPREKVFNQELL